MPKNTARVAKKTEALSIVIPTYNGEPWLALTIDKVLVAVRAADLKDFELIVINDGSTDKTVEVVKSHAKKLGVPIKVVTQENSGRFVARMTGANEAKNDLILFVDTRVFIGKTSLKYVLSKRAEDSSRKVWCSHVRVETRGNIYARFWEAIAFVAWRKYFRKPKDTSYGLQEFDDYPKGTTCFVTEKKLFQEANKWFLKNTMDLKTSNDDTLLLRHIAKKNSINISPDFWCLYHARSSMRQYVKHVFHRGKVFVDGFLRNDGNRFYIPLIMFLFGSFVAVPLTVCLAFFAPVVLLYAVVVGLALWLTELAVLLVLGVPAKDAASLFILSPVFGVYYGAGIWHAFVKTKVLRVGNV